MAMIVTRLILAAGWACIALAPPASAQSALPVFDAHVHYSHDAWDNLPPQAAIDVLKKAGIRRALLSSSNDDGQQRLYALAPDIIVPSLRPYRTRGDVGTWAHDTAVIGYLEERLKKYKYAAIGEFHLYGADADSPVPRRMVELARQNGLILHAHSDVQRTPSHRLLPVGPKVAIPICPTARRFQPADETSLNDKRSAGTRSLHHPA